MARLLVAAIYILIRGGGLAAPALLIPNRGQDNLSNYALLPC